MPSHDTPPPERPDLILHIGSGKTGTSSIQQFMNLNRAALGELGYLYPKTPGRTRHTRLSLFIQTDEALHENIAWHRQPFASPQEFRTTFRRRLRREIRRSGLPNVVLSDEALFGSPDDALRRLNRFVRGLGRSLRVVVYLRRQDDHLASRYQQVVKTGETRRLAERVQQLDLSGTYDYYARLRTWERLLQPSSLVVRRFEPAGFIGGSLYQDFLAAAGIDVEADRLKQVANHNESLDAESVEFLRLLNLHRVEHEGAAAGLIDNRELVKRLASTSTGPTLTLPPDRLNDFMAQWEPSNQRVARDILHEPDGQLFRVARKSRHTTTEQYLDPARLEHFLALLELPEPMHAPLREIVEREAKASG